MDCPFKHETEEEQALTFSFSYGYGCIRCDICEACGPNVSYVGAPARGIIGGVVEGSWILGDPRCPYDPTAALEVWKDRTT